MQMVEVVARRSRLSSVFIFQPVAAFGRGKSTKFSATSMPVRGVHARAMLEFRVGGRGRS